VPRINHVDCIQPPGRINTPSLHPTPCLSVEIIFSIIPPPVNPQSYRPQRKARLPALSVFSVPAVGQWIQIRDSSPCFQASDPIQWFQSVGRWRYGGRPPTQSIREVSLWRLNQECAVAVGYKQHASRGLWGAPQRGCRKPAGGGNLMWQVAATSSFLLYYRRKRIITQGFLLNHNENVLM
jgi:hypothetical protein